VNIDLIKNRLTNTLILCGAILALTIVAPAFAQYSGQGYYGGTGEVGWGAYDNNHRWHGARWWHRHYIEWFYASHPEWAVMDALWLTQDGDYDNNNNWHDAYWWHQNDPDFFYANHPQWIPWQPNWRDQDGAYDAQHNWHYGQWWYNQNPNWVSTNHPNWISQHRNWANHSEPQDHRAVMRTENEGNQQNPQQQASIQQKQVNQQSPAQKAAEMYVLLLALALHSGLSH
jgi:hypothetical protein